MKIYVVQKGDSLYEIAQKHGISLADLEKMNPQLTNPDEIMPGMKIKVPIVKKHVKKKEHPVKQQVPNNNMPENVMMNENMTMPVKKTLPVKELPKKKELPIKKVIPTTEEMPMVKHSKKTAPSFPIEDHVEDWHDKNNYSNESDAAPSQAIPMMENDFKNVMMPAHQMPTNQMPEHQTMPNSNPIFNMMPMANQHNNNHVMPMMKGDFPNDMMPMTSDYPNFNNKQNQEANFSHMAQPNHVNQQNQMMPMWSWPHQQDQGNDQKPLYGTGMPQQVMSYPWDAAKAPVMAENWDSPNYDMSPSNNMAMMPEMNQHMPTMPAHTPSPFGYEENNDMMPMNKGMSHPWDMNQAPVMAENWDSPNYDMGPSNNMAMMPEMNQHMPTMPAHHTPLPCGCEENNDMMPMNKGMSHPWDMDQAPVMAENWDSPNYDMSPSNNGPMMPNNQPMQTMPAQAYAYPPQSPCGCAGNSPMPMQAYPQGQYAPTPYMTGGYPFPGYPQQAIGDAPYPNQQHSPAYQQQQMPDNQHPNQMPQKQMWREDVNQRWDSYANYEQSPYQPNFPNNGSK